MTYSQLEIASHLADEVCLLVHIKAECPPDEAHLIGQVHDYLHGMLDEIIDGLEPTDLAQADWHKSLSVGLHRGS